MTDFVHAMVLLFIVVVLPSCGGERSADPSSCASVCERISSLCGEEGPTECEVECEAWVPTERACVAGAEDCAVASRCVVVAPDGGPADGGPADGGPADGGPADGGPADGGPADGGPADGGPDRCPDGVGGPPASASPPLPGTWALEFQEDFLQDVVDDSRWKFGHHWAGFNGDSALAPDNASLECGYLTLRADRRDTEFLGEPYSYASSEISTFKRFRQLYGYFEARIRYDAIVGMWPAFWLMPDRGRYGNVDRNRVSLLKFELDGLPAGSVESAELVLRVAEATSCVQNVAVLGVEDDSWSEDTVTGAGRPVFDPAWVDLQYNGGWSVADTVSFDVTPIVNRAIEGDRVASLALIDGFLRACSVAFVSGEGADEAHRPRIRIPGMPDIVVSEDATLGEGANAARSYGAELTLEVRESWARTASTQDGGMEFDIMESLGHWGPDMTSHALHWDGYAPGHPRLGSGYFSSPPTDDGFHVYGMSWQEGEVRFFVDGVETFSWRNERVGSVPSYILLSLQIGGWSDALGSNRIPDGPSFPGEMVVDYVRVWSGGPD